MSRVFRALVLALVLVGWGYGILAAQIGASFRWDRWDVDISLRPDGTFEVVETQVVRIDGLLRKGYREIRLDRVGGITEISVGEPGHPYTRGYGEPYTFAATRGDELIRIDWWFPATTDATRSFIIRYRVDDAVRVYDYGDQLSWIAVPADRPAIVSDSRVTLRFPSDVSPDQLELDAYPHDSTDTPRQIDPRTAVYHAAEIPADDSFVVRAHFPHGLVRADVPSWQRGADVADWYQANAQPVLNVGVLALTLAILGLGGAVIAGLWYSRGHDPGAGDVLESVDQPPSQLPAGVVGTLVYEHADVQDVVATLVDLAERNVLAITETRNPDLIGSDLDFLLEVLEPDSLGLRAYEKTLIATLFPAGQRATWLSDVKKRFTPAISLFHDQLHAEVVEQGLFAPDPEKVKRRYRMMGWIVLIIGGVGALISGTFVSPFLELAALPFIALALTGLGLVLLARAVPLRTRAGALEAKQWRAFAAYLRGNNGSISKAAPANGWMPYAVALGADQSWLRNLAAVGSPRPGWFRSAALGTRRGTGSGPGIALLPWPGGTDGLPSAQTESAGGVVADLPRDSTELRGSGPREWSESLANMLILASDALSHGGGDDLSGEGEGGRRRRRS